MSKSITFGRVLNGAFTGLVAGAVASWVMNQWTAADQAAQKARREEREEQEAERSGSRESESRKKAQEGGQEEDATVKTAQAISRGLFQHELSPLEKKVAGPAVHYGYGALVGSVYGALSELSPMTSTGFGMLYGIGLWLLGDEMAIPALELGPPPTQIEARKHVDYLSAHLVYGLALDLTRRVARLLL